MAQSHARARFLTVQEVADVLRISTMTVYRLIKSGDLPAARIGKSFRVSEDDLDAFIAKQYTEAG
jgi:excisionase family DNA binding protein